MKVFKFYSEYRVLNHCEAVLHLCHLNLWHPENEDCDYHVGAYVTYYLVDLLRPDSPGNVFRHHLFT
jgi:hypothetical protein